MKYKCALFVVDNIEKAKNFYIEILGQEIKYDFGESVTFKGDFAIHEKKHFSYLLEGLAIHKNPNNSELYFEYDDLEQLENKLEKEKVEFIHQVKEQPWRQKVLRFYDIDKNIIEVGESLEHLVYRLWNEGKSYEEIGEVTDMDNEFVEESIKKFSRR